MGKGQNPCVWKTDLTLVWKKARTDRKRDDKGRQEVLGLKQAAAVGKDKGCLRGGTEQRHG